ncbi:MAG: VWA domain-containing protein [Acidobacteriota bacterium]|nr:MAG: VWA domain-containing protein [Acidobacteriota bacterium]
MALLAALLISGVSLESFAERAQLDEQRVRELMERVSRGGPPLSDAELEELLLALPSEDVAVRLVMLPAIVLDRSGRPVAGLNAEEFRIEVQGKLEPIAWFSEEDDRPLRLAILLDVSESMEPLAGEPTRTALRPLMRRLGPQDRIMLLSFASRGVELQLDWNDRPFATLEHGVAIPRHGRTALRDALDAAAHIVPDAPRERHAIVLVSDGVDNASRTSADDVIATARRVGVPVYVWAVGGVGREFQDRRSDSSPFDPLRRVAGQTGGRLFLVTDRKSADDAAATLAAELRHQYWLALRPTEPSDGRFKPIRITVPGRDVIVRTRAGYY